MTPSLKIVLIKINISVRECWARCPAERRGGDVIHYPGVIQREGQNGRQRKREEETEGNKERRGRHWVGQM